MSQVPRWQVQQALIERFQAWGQPQAIKVDNGRPFGDPASDLIPVLALWLIGLGIDMIWNRPRQPTDNAKVERMQAVTSAWAEPEACASVEILQAHLDEAAFIQRSRYRVRRLQGQTRQEAYPDLLAGGRPYQAEAFELERILAFLAEGTWVRKVSKVGQIDFYGQRWHVGACYQRQHVNLHLEGQQWVIIDEAGSEIKRFEANFISAASIWALSLCQGTET